MFKKINKFITRLEEFIMAYTIIIITLVMGGNIIARYVFGSSWTPTEEICMFCVIMSTFIGASYAARKGQHICMDALISSNILTQRAKIVLIIIISIITIFLSFALVIFGYQYVLINYISGKISPSLRIPWYLISLFFPVGFFLMGIQWIRNLIITIKEKEAYMGPEDNRRKGTCF